MPPKMYAVIKFKQLPTNEIFDYQCVPSSWIRCCNDNRQITVAYPSPVTESTERHIRSGRDPLQKWPLFPAIFVTEIDSYTAWAHILSLIRENYTCDVEDVITMLNPSDQDEHGGNIYLEDFKPELIPDKRNSELTTSTTRQFQEEKKEPSRDMIDFNERKKQELNNERFERESQRPSTSSGQGKLSLDRCIPNNKLNESIVKKMVNFIPDFKPKIIPDKRNSELTTSTTRQFQEEKKEPSRDMIDFNERKKQELNNERFERESQRPSTSSGQGKLSLDRCIPNNKLNESIVKKMVNFIPDFKPKIIPDKRNSELTTSTTRQFQEEKKEPSRDMIDFNERKKQELNNERFERESQRPPTSSGQRKSSLDRSIPNERFERESQRPSTSSGQEKLSLDRCIPNNKLNESIVKKMVNFIPDFKPRIIPDKRNSELTTSTTRQFQEKKKESSRDMIDFNERKKQELNNERFERESQRPPTSSGQRKSSLDRSIPNERFERESQRPPTSSGQRKSSLDRCIPNNKLNELDLHREEELHRRKENTKVNESIGESNRTKYTSIAFHSNREEESHQRNENRKLNGSIGGSSCTKHTSGASDSNRYDELHRDENRKLKGSIGNTSGQKRTSETSFLNQEDELQQKYSKTMKSSSSKALATRTLPQIDRKVLNKFKESCEQITLFLEELLTKNEEGCI